MAVDAVDAGRAPHASAEPAAVAWPSGKAAAWTVFLLILSTAFAQLDLAIVPYVLPSIKGQFHLTDFQVSLLTGASFGLFYALVGIPIAWALDRFSRKWLLGIAISVWSLGTALCGVSQTQLQFFLSRFLVGAGEAVNGPASYSILSDLFPREKLPRAVATMKVGTILGPALSLLITFFLLKTLLQIPPIPIPFGVVHGWQLIMIIVGLPGVLVTVLMLSSMPEPARRTIGGQITGQTKASGAFAALGDYWLVLKYMSAHWQVFLPMFASLFVSSLGLGNALWMPTFYERTFHWSRADVAGLSFIPSFILSPLGLWAGAKIAEHLNARGRDDAVLLAQIIARCIGIPAIFAVMMPSPWLTWGLSALSVFAVGAAAPAQNAAFQIVTPTELRGKMTALFLFVFNFVGVAVAPAITGLITTFILKDEAQIRWAIFTPAVIFGPTSLLITWLGLKAYGREVARLKALEASR
jgi:MFS family permease